MTNAEEVSKNTGVRLFAGVELDTEVGRVLCLPGEPDDWYQGNSWRELANGSEPGSYASAALVESFGARGGAVLVAQPFDRDLEHPCTEAAFAATSGLVAVIVASNPHHAMSNERAVSAARSAKLACVAGSAAAPGAETFGKVATVFSTPPISQTVLIEALRKGRVWPAELGYRTGADRSKGKNTSHASSEHKAQNSRGKGREQGKRGRRRRGDDDNRGNRLDVNRNDGPQYNHFDDRQPDFDPIARLYGRDSRKDNPTGHLAHLSDEELDRVNGNRNRGADPNVMTRPDFSELRAERHHIGLLMKTIDPHRHNQSDSIAMRFALSVLGTADPSEAPPPSSGRRNNNRDNRGGGNRGRRRRSRRRRG